MEGLRNDDTKELQKILKINKIETLDFEHRIGIENINKDQIIICLLGQWAVAGKVLWE